MSLLHSIPNEVNNLVPEYVKVSAAAFKRSFSSYLLAWDGEALYYRETQWMRTDSWVKLQTQDPNYPGVAGWMQSMEEGRYERYLAMYNDSNIDPTLDYIGNISDCAL